LLLLAEKQELETKLAQESQAKDGEHPIDYLSLKLNLVRVNTELIIT
jgi:hypothetical protein